MEVTEQISKFALQYKYNKLSVYKQMKNGRRIPPK